MKPFLVAFPLVMLLFISTVTASEEYEVPLVAASVSAQAGETLTTVSVSLKKPEKPRLYWPVGSISIDLDGKRVEVPHEVFADVAGVDLTSIRLWMSGSMDGGGPFLVVRMRVHSPNFGDADIKHPIYFAFSVRDGRVETRSISRYKDGKQQWQSLPLPSDKQ